MRPIDPGLIGGALGVLIGIVCLFLLRSAGAEIARTQKLLESNHAACLGQIGQVGRAVEFLELSGQSTEDAIGRAMNRSLRSQAMELLRSGMSSDTVASTLGVASREVRLIAGVSGILNQTD